MLGNSVQLIGTVTTNINTNVSGSGLYVMNFSLEVVKKRNGETCVIPIKFFKNERDIATLDFDRNSDLTGCTCIIDGHIEGKVFGDKVYFDIIADNVKIYNATQSSRVNNQTARPVQVTPNYPDFGDINDEDLPF